MTTERTLWVYTVADAEAQIGRELNPTELDDIQDALDEALSSRAADAIDDVVSMWQSPRMPLTHVHAEPEGD